MVHENVTRAGMLDILTELVQGDHIWRSNKNELLNFIEEVRDLLPND